MKFLLKIFENWQFFWVSYFAFFFASVPWKLVKGFWLTRTFESDILIFFFCSSPMKISPRFLVIKDRSKFWSSQTWQHFLTHAKHFEWECKWAYEAARNSERSLFKHVSILILKFSLSEKATKIWCNLPQGFGHYYCSIFGLLKIYYFSIKAFH